MKKKFIETIYDEKQNSITFCYKQHSMYLKLIWGLAFTFVVIFAFEPYILALIFDVPQSESSFFSYMLDVPFTILAIVLLGGIGAGLVSLIPFKGMPYMKRLTIVFPLIIVLLTTCLIYGWIKVGYNEAENIKKSSTKN